MTQLTEPRNLLNFFNALTLRAGAATIRFTPAKLAAGFPNPAADVLDDELDWNELLVSNPPATFAARVTGDSMVGAGIWPNDIVIVDRSITPAPGKIVVAILDGSFTLKRLARSGDRVKLVSENPAYPDIEIDEHRSFEVFGVVTRSIRMSF